MFTDLEHLLPGEKRQNYTICWVEPPTQQSASRRFSLALCAVLGAEFMCDRSPSLDMVQRKLLDSLSSLQVKCKTYKSNHIFGDYYSDKFHYINFAKELIIRKLSKEKEN